MDLLLEIKKFYELLSKHTDRKAATLEELESVAEDVFHNKWKVLTNEIKIGFTNEVIVELTEQLNKIKELVNNEKNN